MTSKATIGSAAKERNGLNPKDFVFIAVFGILLFLVFMVFSIIFSANANLCWFTHTVGALFAGTVFMYLAYRVPKRGAIAIMGVIGWCGRSSDGMFWSGPVGIVVAVSWQTLSQAIRRSAPRPSLSVPLPRSRSASGWGRSLSSL